MKLNLKKERKRLEKEAAQLLHRSYEVCKNGYHSHTVCSIQAAVQHVRFRFHGKITFPFGFAWGASATTGPCMAHDATLVPQAAQDSAKVCPFMT